MGNSWGREVWSWWTRQHAGDEVTRVGAYELRVAVLHRGTRSEGRVGRLFHGDREVRGRARGQAVEAEPGGARFVFLGAERPHLWSVSGWQLEPPAPLP